MKNAFKRSIAFVLVMMLVIPMFISVHAYDISLELDKTTVNVIQSDADQTVEVTLRGAAAFDCCSTGGYVNVADGLTITGVYDWLTGAAIASGSLTYNSAKTQVQWFAETSTTDDENTQNLVTVTIKVPANTPTGDYAVTFSSLQANHEWGTPYDIESTTLNATITVSEAAVVTDPVYEIYYELDSTTDADPDHYMDYDDASATVTAYVYIVSDTAKTLQSFGIVMTNTAGLAVQSFAPNVATDASYEQYKENDNTKIYFGLLGKYNGSTYTNVSVSLPADTPVLLGTVTYTFTSSAAYDTEEAITIVENASFAAGTKNTDISVPEDPSGIVPTITTGTEGHLGAELKVTYDVTYNENKPATATATVSGMPATNPETKQYNISYSIATAPTLGTAWSFKEWNTSADGSGTPYAPAASYTDNADLVLYAIWEPASTTYTIKHWQQNIDNDEYTEVESDRQENVAGITGQLTAATANTYTGFTAQTITQETIADDGSTVVNVYYNRNLYTVVWKSQDGETTYETDTNVRYGAQPSYDSAAPTKANTAEFTYSFANWATATDAETGTAAASLPTVEGDEATITYYAAFSKETNQYTITFDKGAHAADGYGAPAAITDDYGTEITLTEATAAPGYTFTGWSDGSTLYSDLSVPYVITGTATLTAQYSENHYTIHYDINAADATGTVPADKELAYTESYTILAGTSLARTGYQFAGWNTQADGNGTTYSVDDVVSKLSETDGATVILYAKWTTDAYTITYNYDGATTTPSNPTSYNVENLPITLAEPSKTGYTFNGWTIAVKEGETGNVTIDGTDSNKLIAGTYGNLTVKANWIPAEVDYTVKHWQQNLDNDEYTEVTDDAETKQGYTEDETAAVAKDYDHFIAKAFSQVAIAADGSTVVNIYYDRETYTVTYEYTGNVPTGATAPVDANSPYKYGATVTVESAPATVTGYTFGGWKIGGADAGTTFVIDANTTVSGAWSLITYYIRFYKDDNTTLVEAVPFTAETESITAPTVPAKSANADWYENGIWGAYDITQLKDQDVVPSYAKKTFTVTFQDENGTNLTDQGSDPNFDYDDRTIDKPAVPDKPGYEGAWPSDITATPGNKDVQPIYTLIGYTITFDTDGGDAIAPLTYNIESTDTLPAAVNKLFSTFVNWKVTTADGYWTADSTFNAGTPVTGKYGNVTLTAQWTKDESYYIGDYKYAAAGYYLIRIKASAIDSSKIYKFGSDAMYYIDNEAYNLDGSAVFYTLIPDTYVSGVELNDAGLGLITTSDGERTEITYDNDINGDGKVTVADANAIFQMLAQAAHGGYYTDAQLSVEQRLKADTVKATSGEEYFGSIQDVNAIVKQLFNKTASQEALNSMFSCFAVIEEEQRKNKSIDA